MQDPVRPVPTPVPTPDPHAAGGRPAAAGPAPDARVERSRALLHAALLDLVRAGEGKVTVSTVCARAGVSRPTFYQHFQSLDDLLASALRAHHGELVGHPPADPSHTRAAAGALASAIVDDADLYRSLLGAGSGYPQARRALESLLQDRLRAHLQGARPDPAAALRDDETRELTVAFAAGGFVSAIGAWLDAHAEAPRTPQDDVTVLADHLWALMRTTLGD